MKVSKELYSYLKWVRSAYPDSNLWLCNCILDWKCKPFARLTAEKDLHIQMGLWCEKRFGISVEYDITPFATCVVVMCGNGAPVPQETYESAQRVIRAMFIDDMMVQYETEN